MSTHTLLAIPPFLVLCGCALLLTEETKYLQAAQNHATQTEVLKHFGQPDEIQRSETGEASWRYDIYQVEGGSQQSWAAMGSWCDRYSFCSMLRVSSASGRTGPMRMAARTCRSIVMTAMKSKRYE